MLNTSMNVTSSGTLSVRDPWALVPSLGNLDAYIAAVNRIPLLSAEQELAYANRLRSQGDVDSAGKLVLSHLRLVVSIARQYLGYGLPHGDLIQEGNVGLMKAVKRFDPEQGVRLVSYAMHWIKAEIHEYVLKNWRMVKVATTKSQRKLFFNLRSLKQRLKEDSSQGANYSSSLSLTHANTIAKMLKVKREEVLEMDTRLSGNDIALEPSFDEDEDQAYAPIAYLSDDRLEPTRVIENQQRQWLANDGIAQALEGLDARSRRIVEERWLKVHDNGTGGLTLHDLASEYGVSAERIRQIETAALKKMRTTLTPHD
jgi:RNA polymerase sigma-32 factor